MKRKVHRIEKAGSIQNLKLIEEELSDPGNTEFTIEVKAIGLNFADVFALTGLYSATPSGSFIPGLEYSGIIVKSGKNTRKFKKGDRIIGVTRFGAYATHLNIDQKYIYRLPDKWSFEEGAGFIAQSLTAYYALVPLGNIKKNDTVLIHSAAGGVGLYANRIAKKYNAFTIGSVGDATKIPLLKKEGYDEVIVRRRDFFDELQKKLNGRHLTLILECIGGQIFRDSYRSLSPMGRMVVYGSANFTPSESSPNFIKLAYNYLRRPFIDPLSMISENKSVMGFNLIWLWEKAEEFSEMIDKIKALNLKPPHIGRIFSFEDAIEALNFFKTGKSTGKIVLKIKKSAL
ncbi:MAG: medium chain dehydrogenase/reductase family protein [Leptospira sp.]|nr:medium chain dehydrogenase/reductase family protein [Leptospira sp.]